MPRRNPTDVVVPTMALWSAGPVTYHDAGGRVVADALNKHDEPCWQIRTRCGRVHQEQIVEDGSYRYTSVNWPVLHVSHARAIGVPCERCFPPLSQH